MRKTVGEKEKVPMLTSHRPIAALVLALAWGSSSVSGSSLTLTYLQQVSDKYQKTVDVYTIADAAGNHFAARGEFDNLSANLVPAMDEISFNAPCLDVTCITATFNPGLTLWGGWYFMNGILGPSQSQPVANWGFTPNAGYSLTGATSLQFKVRGKVGGERVLFFCCAVGWSPDTGAQVAPFPDSSARVDLGVQLTTDWAQKSIDLTNLNLNYVLGGFGWVASATGDLANLNPITFYLGDIKYLKARPNDPRLLVSYETIKSSNSFDTVERNAAYIYDNAVALTAMVANGDLVRARTIADALVYAQQHDRFFDDGRLRNAYQGGDIVLAPGWIPNNRPNTARMPGWYDVDRANWFEDATQVSSNTGNAAWAGLGLLQLWEVTREQKYLTAAQMLGRWVIDNAGDDPVRGAGGFTGGYDGWENGAVSGSASNCASGTVVNGQCKRLYKSTEHNIDLYAFYSRLFLADGNSDWAVAAQQAKHFFLSMWSSGKFWTGTTEDGVTVSQNVIPVDIQAWAIQALGSEAQPYLGALDYVESHHKTSLGYGFKQDGGNSCGDNTWFEGTSQVAVAYLLAGNSAKWQSILDTSGTAQLPSGAMPATDGTCLNTGFTLNDGSPWLYYPRAHVGATAWRLLAESGVTPYRAELYSPLLSASSVTFPDQSIGGTSAVQSVTLSNRGASPLTMQGIALSGPNAADFAQGNNCGSSVPAGGQCTISITFTPAAQGTRQATLTISEISDPAMQTAKLNIALAGETPPPATVSLNLQIVPAGAGLVVATPPAANGLYASGTQVCLAASASPGWTFQQWTGDPVDPAACLVLNSNKTVTANFVPVGNAPAIHVTAIPAYGSTPGTTAGFVTGVVPSDYQITALVFLSGMGWFSKPDCSATGTALASDGSFSTLLTTGGVDQFATRIALLLVPVSISVPCYQSAGGLPPDLLQQASAQLVLIRSNPNEREIQFAGQAWAVKASTVPVGPGGCVFSDSPDSAVVDAQGSLHLKILNAGGGWSCAEVYSRASVGYGVYEWTVADAPTLDPTAVFGSFTWADAEAQARELDVEFGFTQPGDLTNAQFVVQPASQAGNLQRLSIPASAPITFRMTWQPNGLTFQAYLGVDTNGVKIKEWNYAGTVPPADSEEENFRFNLWLNGGPPASGQTQEVVVSSFQYQPLTVAGAAPTLDAIVNAASYVSGVAPGSIFTVFGRNLSQQTLAASVTPLPNSLADVSVYVDGLSAPLFYVSPNQINAQIAYLTPTGPSVVSVVANGKVSQNLAFLTTAAAPGVFVDRSGNCVAQNADLTLNSPTNPAAVNSIVTLYLNGLGQVDNPVPTGAVAPLVPLSHPVLGGTAKIENVTALMDFIGLVPGLVGVGQANIHVPASLVNGARSLAISIGSFTSNTCSLSIKGGLVGPTVTGLSPSSVTASSPSFTLTVSGTNFMSGSIVQWGGSVLSTSYISPTTLQATVPQTLIVTVGRASVTVVNPNGATSAAVTFTIIAPTPTIGSLSPTSAQAGGTGFTLTVSGTGYLSDSIVQWNGSPLSTSVISATLLHAAVPAALIATAGQASVTVVNPGGTTSGAVAFAINVLPPTLSSISPNTVQAGGAAFTLTVNGTGFLANSSVQWNGSPLSTSFSSATQLQATVSAALITSAGQASVTVVNAGGVASNDAVFTISTPSPTVGSLVPSTADTRAASLSVLTVNGAGFVSGSTVYWNASALPTTFVGATQLQAPISAALHAVPANVNIKVSNPNGLTSNSLPFAVIPFNPAIQGTTQACTVSGKVSGVAPSSAYAVVVYAYTNQYYVQACDFDPPASIAANGGFGPIQSHNGSISVLLVRQGYVPASILSSLPATDGVNVFAVSSVPGTLTGCDVARCPAQ